jgi:hypothetical protein
MKDSKNWAILAILLLFSILSPACIGPPDPTFVAAARANHDAMAPEYIAYVNADQELDEAQRERRRRTVARWDEAIRSREGLR